MGNRRRIRRFVAVISFTILALLAVAPASAQPEKRIALVIGNGKYVHANTLPNPPNDARAVAKALGEIGFEVIQGVDLGYSAMQDKLRDFLDKASAARVAPLFYAGHGLRVDGRNYLAPVDAKLESKSDLNFGTIDLDRILASLDNPARANIIILDACRDNPLARSFAAKSRSAATGAGLAAYTSIGTGSLIAFATAPGKVAADGTGQNSPFTHSLVRHLRTPGLEVRQMLTRVRNDVAVATHDKQVPWDNSSLRGDVYLAGRTKVVEPGKVPVPPLAQSAAQVEELALLKARLRALEQQLLKKDAQKERPQIAAVSPPTSRPIPAPSSVPTHAPAPVSRAVSGPHVQSLVGDWVGKYTCGQGITNVRIRILQADPIKALFHFSAPPENRQAFPDGCFAMSGAYQAKTGRLFLKGGDWITKPGPTWVTADLVGTVDPDGARYAGDVIDNLYHSCSIFSVSKTRAGPLPKECVPGVIVKRRTQPAGSGIE